MTHPGACSVACAKMLVRPTVWNSHRILRWPITPVKAPSGTATGSKRDPPPRATPAKDSGMEIRRDPITQSWVVQGHRGEVSGDAGGCPFCGREAEKQPAILAWPLGGPWQVRVVPHPDPLYRIEGDLGRRAEGMYDKMGPVGAHEVIVESPHHDKRLSGLSDEEIERVLWT